MPEPPSPPSTDRIEALLAAVRARHPALTDADLPRLRQQIERLQASAATLDVYPLANWDEPDAGFRAAEPEGRR